MTTRPTLALLLSAAFVTVAATANAAVFTVGPGGTHATIAAALSAALVAPGDDEIRVRSGVYPESSLKTRTNSVAGGLSITGGWDASFANRSGDAALTVIDAGFSGRVLEVELALDRPLLIEGLTLRRGRLNGARGAGLAAFIVGTTLTVRNCRIQNNETQEAPPAIFKDSAGIFVVAGENGRFELADSWVVANRVTAANDPLGAGMFAIANAAGSSIHVHGSRFEGNQVEATQPGASSRSAAFEINAAFGSATIEDCLIRDNRATAKTGNLGFGLAVTVFAQNGAKAVLRRNVLTGNNTPGGPQSGHQIALSAPNFNSSIVFSDSVVAASRTGGVLAAATNSTIRLTNLTVADNQGGPGASLVLGVNSAAKVSLANSIVLGNLSGIATSPGAKLLANLTAGKPQFVNRGKQDYRLKANSPAIDNGRNTVPGGLGPLDLARTARVKAGRVDQGAYESF